MARAGVVEPVRTVGNGGFDSRQETDRIVRGSEDSIRSGGGTTPDEVFADAVARVGDDDEVPFPAVSVLSERSKTLERETDGNLALVFGGDGGKGKISGRGWEGGGRGGKSGSDVVERDKGDEVSFRLSLKSEGFVRDGSEMFGDFDGGMEGSN
jgi:hypothetical protein